MCGMCIDVSCMCCACKHVWIDVCLQSVHRSSGRMVQSMQYVGAALPPLIDAVCILPLPAHVALVYTVWTLTGVLNSLAHSVMSITTFPHLSS